MNSLRQILIEAKKRARETPETGQTMDVEATRESVLTWLKEVRLPQGTREESWEAILKVYPSGPDEPEESSGVKLRLALPLSTRENKYLIAILECLEPDSRGFYLISVYVNWKAPEKQMQKVVDEGYQGYFVDALRGRHNLWAQTFRLYELAEALNCCAKAILANELVASPASPLEFEKLNILSPRAAQFPVTEDS